MFSSELQYGGAKSFERKGFRDAPRQRLAVTKGRRWRATFANEARFDSMNRPPPWWAPAACPVSQAGYNGGDLVLLTLYVDAVVRPPS
jgi:hypothetical protein